MASAGLSHTFMTHYVTLENHSLKYHDTHDTHSLFISEFIDVLFNVDVLNMNIFLNVISILDCWIVVPEKYMYVRQTA